MNQQLHARRARGLLLSAITLCAISVAAGATSSIQPPPTGYTFTAHVIPVTAANPSAIAIADVNGDTRQDIGISYATGSILWYQNVPGSPVTFTERPVDLAIDNAQVLAAGLLNNDGLIDFVSARNAAPLGTTVRWMRNNGGAPTTFSRFDVDGAGGPGVVAIADLDLMLGNDILFARNSASGPSVRWFQNLGGANPQWFGRTIVSSINAPAVVAADLNNDSRPDVITVDVNTNAILWFANIAATGDGTPLPEFVQHTVGAAPLTAPRLAVDNLNGDSFKDVVVASETGLRWFENQGGAVPDFVPHLITFNESQPQAVAIADINGDGRKDIVVAFGTSRSVAWYENNGATPPEFIEHVIFSGVASTGIESLAIADINGDGGPDIVVAASLSSQVYWLERTTISVDRSAFPGGGGSSDNIQFAADAPDTVVTGTVGQSAAHASKGGAFEVRGGFWLNPENTVAPCPGDTDGDGDIDFIDLNRVLSAFGTSAGNPNFIAGADLDHDGDVDFVDLNTVLSFFGTAC